LPDLSVYEKLRSGVIGNGVVSEEAVIANW
jgi:hypothetical protein